MIFRMGWTQADVRELQLIRANDPDLWKSVLVLIRERAVVLVANGMVNVDDDTPAA